MTKQTSFIKIVGIAGLLALSTCGGPIIGSTTAMMYATKPSSPDPADTASQIPEHETWCYQTLADSDCYSHIQDTQPDRLINVDPQNRYPLTRRAYHEAVVEANK